MNAAETKIDQTDLQTLKALLRRWGVPFAMDNEGTGYQLIVGERWRFDGRNPPSEQVTGYLDFYTAFEFDPDGKFLRMGAWE